MNLKTILNLLPISAGGGLQNTLSFLETLAADETRRDEVDIYCQKNTVLGEFCRTHFNHPTLINRGWYPRLDLERRRFSASLNSNLCFTLFGAPTFGLRRHFVNVCGCAYSNLLYPEIDFWNSLRGFGYLRKQMIDFIRRKSLKSADFWIFETEVLQRRAVRLFNFPSKRVAVVKMAPSGLVTRARIDPIVRADYDHLLRPGYRFLMLAGSHANKQQALVPALMEELQKFGCPDFSFVTTMNEADPYARRVIAEVKSRRLERYWTNIGTVRSSDCPSLIDACDAVVCLSRLESFSNNFVEAWQLRRPLVVTDGDWSRAACGTAAIYVDPLQPKRCAAALQNLVESPTEQIRLVEEGINALKSYHTPKSKYEAYWDALEIARTAGFCSSRERANIRW